MRLENWGFSRTDTINPYLAPEQGRTVVLGNIYGNPKFKDGAFGQTSPVTKIDLAAMKVYTHNSIYELGTINPRFKAYMESNGYTLEMYADAVRINQEGQ